MPTRRKFLEKSTQFAAGALAAGAVAVSSGDAPSPQPPVPAKKLNVLMRSSWGTDDPTRASFAFSHGLALSDAGHDVQIFLTAEATYLMRKETVDVVKPVGWPPLAETMAKIVAKRIPVFA
ncbi:MAG: hypothetical protein WBV55_06665 [Candidatus Sulfotelmatobacter sp.]